MAKERFRGIALVTLLAMLALTACQSAPLAEGEEPPTTAERIEAFGETADAVEAVACPLTTVRNLEGVIVSAIRLLPFFGNWQRVCPEPTSPNAAAPPTG